MKKSYPLSDNIWDFPSTEPGIGPAAPPPVAADTLVVDDGEPYALAVDAGSSGSTGAGSAKTVSGNTTTRSPITGFPTRSLTTSTR
jgi:hypothetical protein